MTLIRLFNTFFIHYSKPTTFMVHLYSLSADINKLTHFKKGPSNIKNGYVQNQYHWSAPSKS